jgi:hypothetical protein
MESAGPKMVENTPFFLPHRQESTTSHPATVGVAGVSPSFHAILLLCCANKEHGGRTHE